MLPLLILLLSLAACTVEAVPSAAIIEAGKLSLPLTIDQLFDCMATQYETVYEQWEKSDQLDYPNYGNPEDSKWQTDTVKDEAWTTGFFPGVLWHLADHYDVSQPAGKAWAVKAENATWGVQSMAYRTDTHDVGFVIVDSFLNALHITGDSKFLPTIETAASSLSTRFSPIVGCIRSWNSDEGFLVIIDNMMNLELLFAAAEYKQNNTWKQQAISHANRTLVEHFRPSNFSTYHVVEYDENDGSVIKKYTAQGYADWSTWARGQAWSVYGFTMAHRYAPDQTQFLIQAVRAAELFIETTFHGDIFSAIPFWDFNAPRFDDDGEPVYQPRDTSATAVAASAFIELSYYVDDTIISERLFNSSIKLITSLINIHMNYKNRFGPLPGMLNNATAGPYHAGDTSHPYDAYFMYGEYYFSEALARLEKYVGPWTSPYAKLTKSVRLKTIVRDE